MLSSPQLLVIAALFNPMRQRIQAVIDRRLYRRKYDAARTLESFGEKVRDEVDLSELSSSLLEIVEQNGPTRAGDSLAEGAEVNFRRLAAWGPYSSRPWQAG